MRQILIIGAKNLLFNIFRQIRKEKLHLVIGDLSLALAQRKTNDQKTQLQ
jgi:hypothetical protein